MKIGIVPREGSSDADSVAYPAYWIARQKTAANGVLRPASSGV